MRQRDSAEEPRALRFEYDLDAPPAKVWRALTVPAFVERWLQPGGPAEPRILLRMIEAREQKSVRYAWREAKAPHLDSTVTFEIAPNVSGGTTFRIVHEPAVAQPQAANTNIPLDAPTMCLAA